MEQQQDYIRDISDIRSMMERSTKFLSLAGWAGIMAGIYALIGAYTAYYYFNFNPDAIVYSTYSEPGKMDVLLKVTLLACIILILSVSTAIYLSQRKASKRNEKLWNATSKRLLINMSVPLFAGGIFSIILISKGLIGLLAPVTLLFYGLSLYLASKFTFDDIKILGLLNISLGLLSSYFTNYGVVCWAIGFGLGHVAYGIYVHYKYEK